MKKYLIIILTLIIATKAFSHTSHYQGLKKIEMDVIRNGKIIGYSNYFFEHEEKVMTVKNYTKFKVELFGLTVFSISSEAIEKYKNDKLISFKSNTFQNDKEKYVKLNYDDRLKKFVIDGSSYKGKASEDCIIGNWWNHKILKSKKQISPLSGSIKQQEVNFISKEILTINGNDISVDHFKLKSTDENLESDKKLDFDIWYDSKNNIIVKVEYNRLGKWQYILKKIE